MYSSKIVFNLDELNAQGIIKALEKEAHQSYPQYYDPKKQEVWRASERMELKLGEIYSR